MSMKKRKTNYVNENEYPQMVIDKLNKVVEYKRNM